MTKMCLSFNKICYILQDVKNEPSDSNITRDSENPVVVTALSGNGRTGNGRESAQSIPSVTETVSFLHIFTSDRASLILLWWGKITLF